MNPVIDLTGSEEGDDQLEGRRAPPPPPPPSMVAVSPAVKKDKDKAVQPQKKKPKKDKEEEGEGGEDEEEEEEEEVIGTLPEAAERIKELKAENVSLRRKHDKLARDVTEMRDILEHALGFSLVRRKSTTNQTTLKYAQGYEPKRAVTEVEFRSADGTARYKGMDREPFGEGGEPGASKKARQKAILKKGEQMVVVLEQPAVISEVLAVPYYTAMEQVKLNTERIAVLNEAVLPIVEQSQLLLTSIASRLGNAPQDIPSTIRQPPAEGDGSLFVWPDARMPHLTEGEVSRRVWNATERQRSEEIAEEEDAARENALAAKFISAHARTARQLAINSGRRLVFPSEGGGGEMGGLLAMQTELANLKAKVEELQRNQQMAEALGTFGRLSGGPGGGDDLFGI